MVPPGQYQAPGHHQAANFYSPGGGRGTSGAGPPGPRSAPQGGGQYGRGGGGSYPQTSVLPVNNPTPVAAPPLVSSAVAPEEGSAHANGDVNEKEKPMGKVLVIGGAVPKKEEEAKSDVDLTATKVAALGVADTPASDEPQPAGETEAASAPSASEGGAKEQEKASVAAPEEEEADPEEDEEFVIPEGDDQRDHLNLVFIGHVDAGKSTIGGQILYLADMVDKRTIEKYEREAKDKNRESWYMAYIMDTNEEERAKGKTVEVGRAHFETEKKRYTILDAPGHKNYVPNMISGASQADVGVLVIAARKGEFETGFERGGQTREHAQLAKTLGVSKMIVLVNKMDDPSVGWSKERYDEIVTKLTPFLKQCGYNIKKDVQFLPISGLQGINMKQRLDSRVCTWYSGPSFFEILDSLEPPDRDPKGPFRMPLIDKYRDMGTVVMGKIESGTVKRGDSLLIMPNKAKVKVVTIFRDNEEVPYARPGENLRIRLSGVEEEDVSPGFVLSSLRRPIGAMLEFDAQLQVLELLDHKAIFTAGYKAVLHLHAVVEECEILDLKQQIDPKTKKAMKKKPLFVKSNAVVVVRVQVAQVICIERFQDFPQLGRFTLRDEGKTVAIGKVTDISTQSSSSN